MSDPSTPKKRSGKGTFSRLRLPVSGKYIVPARRGAMLALGFAVGLVVLILVSVDVVRDGGGVISGGPLSSAHATLESDCASCHSGFQAVADESCSTCHEKAGDTIGTFTFAAHAIYRSGDFGRATTAENEPPCASCHPEHQGRQALVLNVPDSACQDCHERTHFTTDHPEFAFAENPQGDDDTLAFAHGHHTREVMERAGWVDLERACLACHQPTEDGRNFEPINFDLHCDACHLTTGVATPRLVVAQGADDLGVLDLEQVRSSGLPGTDWAFYMDPGEFRGSGGRLFKTPLHHADPWLLFNLRRLRQMRFPDAGLADLLVATPDLDSADARELYREAVSTLEAQVVGLRGTSDAAAQAQLAEIEQRLVQVREALEDPLVPLDESSLALALSQPAEMAPEALDDWKGLVAGLTEACTECHQVERATIARVRDDQRTLIRSEFDHGAHVIQRRCLDCHGELPILEALSLPEGQKVDAARDNSSIHNLPRIASCRECHGGGLVASRCIDCHAYHPDTERHGDLLLHLE